MGLQRTNMGATAAVATSAAAIYTNGSSIKSLVTGVLLYNDNTSGLTVMIYNVPASGGSVGTAATGNKIAEVTLIPKETLWIGFGEPGILLTATNDTIQASTTIANKVNATMTGDTIT